MSKTAATVTPLADLQARMRPTDEQLAMAARELAAQAETWPGITDFLAAVPLAQPGKQYGAWTIGQPVEPVEGCWVGRNTFDSDAEGGSYAEARDNAADAARDHLGTRPGTVAWVTVSPDGHWSVHEDFPRD